MRHDLHGDAGLLRELLRKREVAQALGLSTVQIWRLQNAGKFPRAIQLGEHSVGWRASDIQAWIDSRPLAGDVPVKRKPPVSPGRPKSSGTKGRKRKANEGTEAS